MGKRSISLLVIAALVGAITFVGVADAQAPDAGTIEGTVLDVVSADPLGGIEVCLSVDGLDAQALCVLTADDGTWEFTDLASGSYTVDYTDPAGVFEPLSVTVDFVASGSLAAEASLAPVSPPPTPTATSIPFPTPTPTATATPSPTPTATSTPSPTPTATTTPTPTVDCANVPIPTVVNGQFFPPSIPVCEPGLTPSATPTATSIPTPTAVVAPGRGLITGTITVLSDASPVFGAQVCALSLIHI